MASNRTIEYAQCHDLMLSIVTRHMHAVRKRLYSIVQLVSSSFITDVAGTTHFERAHWCSFCPLITRQGVWKAVVVSIWHQNWRIKRFQLNSHNVYNWNAVRYVITQHWDLQTRYVTDIAVTDILTCTHGASLVPRPSPSKGPGDEATMVHAQRVNYALSI